jgi:hypothetical protein
MQIVAVPKREIDKRHTQYELKLRRERKTATRVKWKEIDEKVFRAHDQKFPRSCIPMAVEFILKLLDLVPLDYFELQHQWNKSPYDNSSYFDGRIEHGVKFTRRFPHERDANFPLNDLFATIEDELRQRRYVAVALRVPGTPYFHNYVVYNSPSGGEFEAVTKCQYPEKIANVKQRVRDMNGTDILTYELLDGQ